MTKTLPLGNQKKTLRTVKIKLENLRKVTINIVNICYYVLQLEEKRAEDERKAKRQERAEKRRNASPSKSGSPTKRGRPKKI